MSDTGHDHDLDEDAAPADLADLSDHMAGAAAQFVRSVEAVAGAGVPDEAVSILLLIAVVGAIAVARPLKDVVDEDADTGPDDGNAPARAARRGHL